MVRLAPLHSCVHLASPLTPVALTPLSSHRAQRPSWRRSRPTCRMIWRSCCSGPWLVCRRSAPGAGARAARRAAPRMPRQRRAGVGARPAEQGRRRLRPLPGELLLRSSLPLHCVSHARRAAPTGVLAAPPSERILSMLGTLVLRVSKWLLQANDHAALLYDSRAACVSPPIPRPLGKLAGHRDIRAGPSAVGARRRRCHRATCHVSKHALVPISRQRCGDKSAHFRATEPQQGTGNTRKRFPSASTSNAS